MIKLLSAASAAAMLTIAGHLPTMAQSSSSAMSTPMITCRDLGTMDRDMARSVVFYVSGFSAASGSLQNQASGSGTMDSSSSGSTAADAGSSGSSGSSGSADVTGSTSTAGSAGSGTSGSASGASSGASGAVVAQLPGFSAIDIDRIMSACASAPDRQISDMIGKGTTGSTTP